MPLFICEFHNWQQRKISTNSAANRLSGDNESWADFNPRQDEPKTKEDVEFVTLYICHTYTE